MFLEQEISVEEIKKREREKRDKEAEGYIDFVEKVYGPFRSKAYTETIINFCELHSDQVWLDAGSGVGRLSVEIAPQVRKIVCIDHSLSSLKVLKKKAFVNNVMNIETVHTDLCNFNCNGDEFDGILCNEVLQHLPTHEERLRGMKNLYRILRPGARCIVNVIRWKKTIDEDKDGYWGENQEIYRYYFSETEITELFKEAGFRAPIMRGLDIIPRRITDLLPVQWSWLEVWCARIPVSRKFGNNLVAIGIK